MNAGKALSCAPFGPIGSDSCGRARVLADRGRSILRADLHVHSRHSRWCEAAGRVPGAGDPEAIAAAASARGMDLLTLTDLDTIDGCLAYLDRHPEADHFFVSEEVTACDPKSGAPVRVLMFGTSERHHREVRRLRGDLGELARYARAEGIPIALAQPPGARFMEGSSAFDPAPLAGRFDLFEIRNGARSRAQNQLLSRLLHEALDGRVAGLTAGSGSHGPARAGRTFTLAIARDREEFLSSLVRRSTWVGGAEGSLWSGAADLFRIARDGEGPLLRGMPLLVRQTLRTARLDARLRGARRRLDRLDRLRFQEKARIYASEAPEAGWPGVSADQLEREPAAQASISTMSSN